MDDVETLCPCADPCRRRDPGFCARPLSGCAFSGVYSVFIGGAPVLRLADVVNCPAELYEIVPGITIEGQPLVRMRSGSGDKGDCTAKGNESVIANGQATQRIGDVACRTR